MSGVTQTAAALENGSVMYFLHQALADPKVQEHIRNFIRQPVIPLTERQKERLHELKKNVHIGVMKNGIRAPLCGTKDPKYFTGWPAYPLSSNGPSGCDECIAVYASNYLNNLGD
jgi:hypothetical protein